jgi:hypothetical protein
MTHRRWRPVVFAVGHLGLQALLCAALWTGFTLLRGRSALALGVVCLGCVALGVISGALRRGWFEACAAILLVSIAALTGFYRVYVLDFVGGPPSFWIALRETATLAVPYAAMLAIVSFAGWYAARAVLRRRQPARPGSPVPHNSGLQ